MNFARKAHVRNSFLFPFRQRRESLHFRGPTSLSISKARFACRDANLPPIWHVGNARYGGTLQCKWDGSHVSLTMLARRGHSWTPGRNP